MRHKDMTKEEILTCTRDPRDLSRETLHVFFFTIQRLLRDKHGKRRYEEA